MSDQFYEQGGNFQAGYYDPYSGQAQETPAMRTLREKAEKDSKRIKELEELVSKYETKETRSSVADLLKNKGANPALAKFALQDGVKPSEEAVAAWLTENGPLFGFNPEQGTQQTPEPATQGQQAQTQSTAVTAPQGTPNVTPEAIAAIQAILEAQTGAVPAQFQGVQAELENAQTPEDLMRVINAHQ